MGNLDNMTAERWNDMPLSEREKMRDYSDLTEQLKGLEGWRVEVITTYGEKRRFIVGRSTGWRPCHIEISRRSAFGGPSAEREYTSVRKLYYAR